MLPSLAHKDDELETPDWVMSLLEAWIGGKFLLDVAANEKNTKCICFLTDGLNSNWTVNNINSAGIIGSPQYAPTFCNPPRSKNGLFVRKCFKEWEEHNMDVVVLVCWNDLGNKYGQECIWEPYRRGAMIDFLNLGKIKFNKGGKQTDFVSRLSYVAVWFKHRPELKQTHI